MSFFYDLIEKILNFSNKVFVFLSNLFHKVRNFLEPVIRLYLKVKTFLRQHVFGWWKGTPFEYYVLNAKVLMVVSSTFLIPLGTLYLIEGLYNSEYRVYVDMILRDAQKGAGG